MNTNRLRLLVALFAVAFVGCDYGNGRLLEVSNIGTGVVKLRPNPGARTVLLGENGCREIALPAKFRVGNAVVEVEKQVKIIGDDALVHIQYFRDGRTWNMTLGEGGAAEFDVSDSLVVEGASFRMLR